MFQLPLLQYRNLCTLSCARFAVITLLLAGALVSATRAETFQTGDRVILEALGSMGTRRTARLPWRPHSVGHSVGRFGNSPSVANDLLSTRIFTSGPITSKQYSNAIACSCPTKRAGASS
jgi:hypothetical protein